MTRLDHNTTHQELSLLLPWYVNKTLQGDELAAVEKHLTVCLTCKRELMQLQKLAQAVVADDSLSSAEQLSFSRLKKRLHNAQAENGAATVASNNVTSIQDAKKRKWSGTAISRSALAMAAAVLLSLIVPRYVEVELKHGNDFRTLSDSPIVAKAIAANEIRVVFADSTNQQQKDEILSQIQGEIVDVPTAQGVFTVQLKAEIGKQDLLAIVDMLRKDSKVIFAEPAYALLSSSPMEKSNEN